MARRSYRQNCSLARAADVIGERWTLLLLRDLLVGPRRFGELSRSQKGMGSNLLASRLRELEAAGIVERQSDDRGSPHYALTERGRALEPALLALVRWGMIYGPEGRQGFHHQADWDLLALKALFHPEYAQDLSVRVQFKTDDFTGWVSVHDQRVVVGLGETPAADLTVDGTIKDLFTGPGSRPSPAVTGSADLLRRFRAAFILRLSA